MNVSGTLETGVGKKTKFAGIGFNMPKTPPSRRGKIWVTV